MMFGSTKFRSVALPAEHGGWAFILEPIVLGLLLASSMQGWWIGLAAFFCFLIRHPLKLALSDRRKRLNLQRTSLADQFACIYAAAAGVFFTLAMMGGARTFLVPFVLAAPLLLIQLTFDAFGQSRKLLPEVAGSIAAGSITTAIVIAAGWRTPVAFALWAIVAARNVSTIIYLRTRLNARRVKQTSAAITFVIIVQIVTVAAVVLLARQRLVPALAVPAFVVLAIRAALGVANLDLPATPKKLGIAEIVFGALTVASVAVGYRLNW